MISNTFFSNQNKFRFAYSIKAMIPEHLKLNDIPLEFRQVPEKNDHVMFFKDGFNTQEEATKNAEEKLKEYGKLSPLLITYYSIGDKEK